MGWHLPPLNALRAFEAAGRHSSVTLGAEELHVTPGAVSRQIKLLETRLGVQLFARNNREIRLTAESAVVLDSLTDAFRRLDAAAGKLRDSGRQRPLRIMCSGNVATRWLFPRLRQFHTSHPHRNVMLTTSLTTVTAAFESDAADMVIRLGTDPWPADIVAHYLFDSEVIPICSPELLRLGSGLSRPEDLRNYTLLYSERRPEVWERWLRLAGLPAFGTFTTQSFYGRFKKAQDQGVTEFKHEWEREFYGPKSHHIVTQNTFHKIDRMIDICMENNMLMEFECYDVGHLYILEHHLSKKAMHKPIIVQFLTGILGGIPSSIEHLLHMKQTARPWAARWRCSPARPIPTGCAASSRPRPRSACQRAAAPPSRRARWRSSPPDPAPPSTNRSTATTRRCCAPSRPALPAPGPSAWPPTARASPRPCACWPRWTWRRRWPAWRFPAGCWRASMTAAARRTKSVPLRP